MARNYQVQKEYFGLAIAREEMEQEDSTRVLRDSIKEDKKLLTKECQNMLQKIEEILNRRSTHSGS